jgi:3-oxoacyl-[acyl-carrier-protein] synthase-3
MQSASVSAFAYELGERELPYRDASNFARVLEENNYPDQPAMFGWGSFRQSERDVFDLGIAAARRTLQQAELAPGDVDALFFCTTQFPGDAIEHIGFNVRLLGGLGLTNAFPIGLTLNNCAAFLSAIGMAVAMVGAGRCRNALLVTADKCLDENIRMTNFALLSDGAAACIVSGDGRPGYELVAQAFAPSEEPIENNRGKDDPQLYQRVVQRIASQSPVPLSDVKKVLCSNIFKPVTQLKESKLGFQRRQLFLDNVPRYGHCFSADTAINLVDCESQGILARGDHVLLAADAPNLRASVMLRKAA